MVSGLVAAAVFCIVLWPVLVRAHCDTLDGPVVKAARVALEKKDITPVLRWVQKDQETELKGIFAQALAVRAKGPEAMELADRYFFETLVRLHRAGEGAPFTGLKPAGAVEPIVAAADKALEAGSADDLVKEVTKATADGIRTRFAAALETRKKADTSVEAGREAVEAYVQYVHFVERLHGDATSSPAGHEEEGGAGGKGKPTHED